MYACLIREPAGAGTGAALETAARACSPRVARIGPDAVLFDARGLTRAIGPASDIAREVARLAADHGVEARVAIAGSMTAAWLLARATPGVTVAPFARRAQAAAVSTLPLSWLSTLPDFRRGVAGWSNAGADFVGPAEAGPSGRQNSRQASGASGGAGFSRPHAKAVGRPTPRRRKGARTRHYRLAPGPEPGVFGEPPPLVPDVDEHLVTLARWGLRTLGDLARLPRADLHARLGPAGVRLHQAACGEDAVPLVPAGAAPRFLERVELEWPVEGLEPLSFVLGRLCDALSSSLERANRGAVGLTTRLRLVTRETHARALRLPAPMRDARVLRTLIQLDLESHPPAAGIDVVEIEADVAPATIVQGSLLARAMPAGEHLATLLARLGALMGESRVGAPAPVDTHDDRAVAMTAFAPASRMPSSGESPPAAPAPGFRRFRLPIAARVSVSRGLPARVQPSARGLPGGVVVAAAGPWRSSGRWWSLAGDGWDRDEWDVEVAGGHLYRLSRDRASGQWVIEGAVD